MKFGLTLEALKDEAHRLFADAKAKSNAEQIKFGYEIEIHFT